jgi:hypothetical protein
LALTPWAHHCTCGHPLLEAIKFAISVTDLGFARPGGADEDDPAQRALGIVWLGTLSVSAPHYEISGKHATPTGSLEGSNASMHPRLPYSASSDDYRTLIAGSSAHVRRTEAADRAGSVKPELGESGKKAVTIRVGLAIL